MILSHELQKVVWYLQNGRASDAAEHCKDILDVAPMNIEALNYYGIASCEQGYMDEAITSYRKALDLNPNSPEVHNNIGIALKALGRNDEAVENYQKAIRLRPNYPEAFNNLGIALKDLDRRDEATACFHKATKLRNNYPEAHNNLGTMLQEEKHLEEAIICYQKSLELNPNYVIAYNNLGMSLKDLNRYEEAFVCYQKALEIRPNYPEAYNNLGNMLHELNRHEEAIACYQKALDLKPTYGNAASMLADQKLKCCDWRSYKDLQQTFKSWVYTERDPLTPSVFLAFSDDPKEQFLCANKYRDKNIGHPLQLSPLNIHNAAEPVRLAYLSADFHRHATAYLIAEMLEIHDRGEFEIHAISFGPDVADPMRKRLIEAFDRFHDVHEKSDHEIAQLIRDLGIQIAVDLKGYTHNCRPSILAYRPAPIQVCYLGFPGTMGAEFIDYILVDPYIVPAGQQPFFSENIVYLPDCYQVNDSKREIAKNIPSRADCGLPDDVFVFCCFNYCYKITPTIFGTWMRLLEAVPGSVLWLLADNNVAERNLRREASGRGVKPERIIFASREDLPKHLARQKQADLFLDTFPIGAHTTASDALWAGLPILTYAGRSFASRVCGSMLNTIGLPELVTYSLESYEALALALARDHKLLHSYREKLAINREVSPLFDCERFTRNIEAAYMVMLKQLKEGRSPQSFSLSAY